jgi:putative GTP pyrophosphokinase
MSDSISNLYQIRFNSVLQKLAKNIEVYLTDILKDEKRIDRISARPKSVERFLKKAATAKEKTPKYNDPLSQIQDQVGARIIVLYKSDVSQIDSVVMKYFRSIEQKTHIPDSVNEFGYFGRHHILSIPTDVIEDGFDPKDIPKFFEIQIKTLFQHAWSEAEHDLGYKPSDRSLSADELRKIAFTSAQAWGADEIFDQLFNENAKQKNG